MTEAEAQALVKARPETEAYWELRRDGFLDLHARPCPYLEGNTCSVYDVRPLNCRRWGCYREPGEPLTDLAPVPLRVLRDPALRDHYAKNQARAHQEWGLSHGWVDTGDPE